jgi:uncharacterized iron-regulated membrane protein
MRDALDRNPGAMLTALVMPGAEAPWYRVRLRTIDEAPRIWGTTTLFYSTDEGRLLLEQRAGRVSAARRCIDALYPLHTGQIGGGLLRAVVLLTGLGVIAMFGIGWQAWRHRRASRTAS